ncbi:MAG: MerC domain-containing protein [Balneolales bacterium]|nr:MerC domain-containing protein [Balneolales bacterium]
MNLTISKSDTLGVFAGTLCILHCFATPFLFVALAGSASYGGEAPLWWLSISYIFLGISFFAVYRSTQTTSRSFMKPLFWVSWIVLSFVIVNEQFEWLELAEMFSYLAAFILVGLHLYNRRYCQCESDHCCVENE